VLTNLRFLPFDWRNDASVTPRFFIEPAHKISITANAGESFQHHRAGQRAGALHSKKVELSKKINTFLLGGYLKGDWEQLSDIYTSEYVYFLY